MADNLRETGPIGSTPADPTGQIEENGMIAQLETQEPGRGSASPTPDPSRANTPALVSPLPENVMKLREEYRRSSAGSASKISGPLSRMRSLKSKMIEKFKPGRKANVPRRRDIKDPVMGGLPDTVTQRKPSRLSRNTRPTVYIPSGTATEMRPFSNDRAPTPYTPSKSPAGTINKTLPAIPESHGSPISFNTLANFDDPFVIASTPEHTSPSRPKAPDRDSRISVDQIEQSLPANALNHRILSFLLSREQDEVQDRFKVQEYRKRARDALDAQADAIKYQIETKRNEITALEEQTQAVEERARVLAEVQEHEDSLEERWKEKRVELENMIESVGGNEI